MSHSFVSFIDEAGCEGGDHGSGGSEWFVLAALIARATRETDVLNAVDEFKKEINREPVWRFKFSGLEPKRKILICKLIAQKACKIVAIVVHKPSIRDERLRKNHERLYFYYGKFLIERISWVCRDYHGDEDDGDGTVAITFSNRRHFPYDEFREYVRRLPESDPKSRAAWQHIRHDQITSERHNESKGCILADASASAISLAIQYTQYNITDSRPILALRSKIYAPNGVVRGNGIKFFPQEAETLISSEERFEWARFQIKLV